MEQVNPTRMELIKKRAQIRLAEQGRDLLREKMDALIREFFRIMTNVSDSRGKLEAVADSAQRSLLIAEAVDDPVTLKSASFATKRRISLDIRGKNIMGVPVPIIEKKRFTLTITERGYSPIGISGRIDETAERFETELDLIIVLAETETALRRIGEEIQMNRRRVNALEQVLIPELKQQAKYIKITIEEREREDLYRLKKVKRLLQKKKQKGSEVSPQEQD
ncbi:MAG TPA: V-type ATP synthase subunit D [Methanoregulaceae archaeon]|nr:V-type ATP synthase subunit D [Methanoregulaceae archaeon]HPA08429.1 V-type ATP synthase subunit D [Methanoregulaceae archaeon]HQN89209.1 V-type ATP synthase subunit D [Methanoregulaceae archaeon]HQP82037.1 V-type ATP synthase subunit D [Methanoregulaceae archaeon]